MTRDHRLPASKGTARAFAADGQLQRQRQRQKQAASSLAGAKGNGTN